MGLQGKAKDVLTRGILYRRQLYTVIEIEITNTIFCGEFELRTFHVVIVAVHNGP